jgi:hypothetical protein
MVLKRGLVFFALVILLGLAVSLFVFFNAKDIAPLTLTIRLLALNGYIALSVAAIMTPFLKEVTLFFQKILHQNTPLFCCSWTITYHSTSNYSFCPNFKPNCFSAKFWVNLPLLFFRWHHSSSSHLCCVWNGIFA